jgi:hypothetical protein
MSVNAMKKGHLISLRVAVTAAVMLFAFAHLAWEYVNGGILSHHLLARNDLPAISNTWGILLLPALAWFASGRSATLMTVGGVAGFIGAAAFGALLAGAFVLGFEDAAGYLLVAMLLLALLLPVYRAECLLGFVLGMTLTFGAVLPTMVGIAVAGISAIAQVFVRPLLRGFWRRLRHIKRTAT